MSQQQWGNPGTGPWGSGWPGQANVPGGPSPAGWGQQPTGTWGQPQATWGQPQASSGWGQYQARQQPYGPSGGWYPPPPRRKRSGIASALKIVLAIVAILFVASFIKGVLAGGAQDSGSSATDPSSPLQPYVNEDYSPPPADFNPPPLPGPRNLQAAVTLTTDNPLYETSVPSPTNCTLARIDVRSATARAMEDHFNDLMGCLMRVYDPPVSQAGFEMPRPPVTVYTAPIVTACGTFDDVNAAYCTGDQRIYYAYPLLDSFPTAVASVDYAAEMILAHEFGHAVQARTAILISQNVLSAQASTDDAALELSRRTEVQADCFAGLYVQSVARSQALGSNELAGLRRLAYALGDDVLSGRQGFTDAHGTGAARQRWFDAGLSSNQVVQCNTFAASSNQVR